MVSGKVEKQDNKKFLCTFRGCNKVFSRSDHLSRHKLTHSGPTLECSYPGCKRLFTRSDIKRKHELIHNKKVETKFIDYESPSHNKVHHEIKSDDTIEEKKSEDVPKLRQGKMDLSGFNAELDNTHISKLIDWGLKSFNSCAIIGFESSSSLVMEKYIEGIEPNSLLLLKSESIYGHTEMKDCYEKVVDLVPQLKDTNCFNKELLHKYLESYWAIFHPQYPILHRPSFCAESCPNVLLLAVVLLGGFYSSKNDKSENNKLIMKNIEAKVCTLFQEPEILNITDLTTIQSIMLYEVYEISNSSTFCEPRFVSDRLKFQVLKSLINSEYLQCPNLGETGTNYFIDDWILRESLRRVFFMALCVDTIESFFMGTENLLPGDIAALKIPCSEHLWEATQISPIEFRKELVGISLHTGLKKMYRREVLNAGCFAMNAIVAGLVNILRKLERLTEVSSLVSIGEVYLLRNQTIDALIFWEGVLTKHRESYNSLAWELSYCTLSLGVMFSSINLEDIQIFIGLSKRNARMYEKTLEAIIEWDHSGHAYTSVIYSIRALSQILTSLHEDGKTLLDYAPSEDVIYQRSKVLLSVIMLLTVYTFGVFGPEDGFELPGSNNLSESSSDWLAKVESGLFLQTNFFLREKLSGNFSFDKTMIDSFVKKIGNVPEIGYIDSLIRIMKFVYLKDNSEKSKFFLNLLDLCRNRKKSTNALVFYASGHGFGTL